MHALECFQRPPVFIKRKGEPFRVGRSGVDLCYLPLFPDDIQEGFEEITVQESKSAGFRIVTVGVGPGRPEAERRLLTMGLE